MYFNFDPAVIDDLMLVAAGRSVTELARERIRTHAIALSRAPVLFRCRIVGTFELGDPGAPQRLDCDLTAAAGAQLALANPGRSDLVRAADFAEPGVKHPENSVRSGIVRFADLLERNGHRAIAGAVRTVKVVRGADGNHYLVAPLRRTVDLITE